MREQLNQVSKQLCSPAPTIKGQCASLQGMCVCPSCLCSSQASAVCAAPAVRAYAPLGLVLRWQVLRRSTGSFDCIRPDNSLYHEPLQDLAKASAWGQKLKLGRGVGICGDCIKYAKHYCGDPSKCKAQQVV